MKQKCIKSSRIEQHIYICNDWSTKEEVAYKKNFMRLTKNEKKVLKLLLSNAKMTDSEIAVQLRISSVAVGKIRRKLESSVITSYCAVLDYAKLGIQTFALAIAKITAPGLDKGEFEIEQTLLENPHIISVYRIPKTKSTHIILYGFQDITEFEEFFHSSRLKQDLHKYIENQELYTFSHNSLLKNSPVQLFHKMLDEFTVKNGSTCFPELERFKQRL